MTKLCAITGDGIGKEVVPAAVAVLQTMMPELQVEWAEAGFACFERVGEAVPQTTLEAVRHCGAGLFGAVSSPSHPVAGYRSAILTLRRELGLYANLRPAYSLPGVSPQSGIRIMVVRENSEGLYAGRERTQNGTAIAERVISEAASRRLAQQTAALVEKRTVKRVTVVHKANVLPQTCGLFLKTTTAVLEPICRKYGAVLDHMLADVAALRMMSEPRQFEVIVTTNLMGDLLSDMAAYWMGGLGFAPSVNLGDGLALAEPVHGSAPDIAGRGIANPLAAILSGALLLRHHWQQPQLASQLEAAVCRTLHMQSAGNRPKTTRQWQQAVLHQLQAVETPML